MENVSEYVTIKTRTGNTIEFTYDGHRRYINPKKGWTGPRNIAELAIGQHALTWNPDNGFVTSSLLYIEGEDSYPSDPITEEEIAKVKSTDGLGDDFIMIDGKPVAKKSINLRPGRGPLKEDFSGNNN